MVDESQNTTHSCRCLNVKIRALPWTAAPQPPFTPHQESDYSLVHVADKGTIVEHLALTSCARQKRSDDPSQHIRYAALSCLICQTIAFRVQQVVPLDVEGKEIPPSSTDEPSTEEILNSIHGWIEVHNNCLTGDQLTSAVSTGLYLDNFSLLLPSPPSPPSRLDIHPSVNNADREPSPALSFPPESFFSQLRPLFLPSPFTPSHPVFVHLSAAALEKSQAKRAAVTDHVAQIIKSKAAEIERFDDQLLREVELLWKRFVASIDDHRRNDTRRRNSDPWSGTTAGPESRLGPITINNFVPTRTPIHRAASAATAPRTSSLSASLGTAPHVSAPGHQPNASFSSTRSSPPPSQSSPSSHDFSAHSLSTPTTSSSHAISIHARTGGSSLLNEPLRRDMDLSKDFVTSFRYFTIEAEMKKGRQPQAPADVRDVAEQVPKPDLEPSNEAGANANETNQPLGNESLQISQTNLDPSTSNAIEGAGASETTPPPLQVNGPKGKRKVTFDVEPDIVTIKREVNSEKREEEEAERAERDAGAMIFDLEESGNESSSGGARPMLTLVDPIRAPVRGPRSRGLRPSSGHGLPESFSSLRPASLPLPTQVRPSISPAFEEEAFSRSLRSPAPRTSPPKKPQKPPHDFRVTEPLEEDSTKVAVSGNSSHGRVWKGDSKAWQLFAQRQGERASVPLIPEEETGEDDNHSSDRLQEDSERDASATWSGYNDPTPGPSSLPIAIGLLHHDLPPASETLRDDITPAYRQALAAENGPPTEDVPRRATHVERGIIDPGALDSDSDDSDANNRPPEVGQRGRERALRILQARSELPGESMWRSLAS